MRTRVIVVAPKLARPARGGGWLTQLCCGRGDGNVPLQSSMWKYVYADPSTNPEKV
jgi:hypothetical protein